jgi:xanthine dehydrogenase molybdenum-binding subunit
VSSRGVGPDTSSEPQYGAQYRLIGKNYVTADLHAKVTGKAKYAEDYRAACMLFCKLLLSPLPHAYQAHRYVGGARHARRQSDSDGGRRSRSGRYPHRNGTVIKASKWGERGLTNAPFYQGEPILAVAAVDELTAAEAIEKIRVDFEPLPFVIDPLETLRPGGPNPRTDGNVWVQPGLHDPPQPKVAELKKKS